MTIGESHAVGHKLTRGGFSYRLKKEFGYLGEVWQRGFSEVRIIGTTEVVPLKFGAFVVEPERRSYVKDG
jgi:hypothetical protein